MEGDRLCVLTRLTFFLAYHTLTILPVLHERLSLGCTNVSLLVKWEKDACLALSICLETRSFFEVSTRPASLSSQERPKAKNVF